MQFVGGSKLVVSGSVLEVVYPVEAVWDYGVGSFVYPFVFSSDSSWTVDVCARVPAGYSVVGVYDEFGNVVGGGCAQAFVAGQTKVVAFDVVRVGSPKRWVFGARLSFRGPKGVAGVVDLSVPSVVGVRGRPFVSGGDFFVDTGRAYCRLFGLFCGWV
ncbi:MAG: hypothetical protein QW308_02070 [Candidatus Woesearchaeota archaeon]